MKFIEGLMIMVVLFMSDFIISYIGLLLFSFLVSYCFFNGKRNTGLYRDLIIFTLFFILSLKFSGVL